MKESRGEFDVVWEAKDGNSAEDWFRFVGLAVHVCLDLVASMPMQTAVCGRTGPTSSIVLQVTSPLHITITFVDNTTSPPIHQHMCPVFQYPFLFGTPLPYATYTGAYSIYKLLGVVTIAQNCGSSLPLLSAAEPGQTDLSVKPPDKTSKAPSETRHAQHQNRWWDRRMALTKRQRGFPRFCFHLALGQPKVCPYVCVFNPESHQSMRCHVFFRLRHVEPLTAKLSTAHELARD